jgi:hypothetical protein
MAESSMMARITAQQLAEELRELIDVYWGIAIEEGATGRTTDTPDGIANQTLCGIEQRINALVRMAAACDSPWFLVPSAMQEPRS